MATARDALERCYGQLENKPKATIPVTTKLSLLGIITKKLKIYLFKINVSLKL
jgi:hypothetical protein